MKPLKKVLDEWRAGKVASSVTMYRVLAPNVQLLQLWPQYKPGETIPAELSPRIIYLIFDSDQAVGAVEPQEDNLQALMLTQWRAKGLFSKAMKEVILPHILQSKPLQRLQLQRSEYGERRADQLKKMALSMGFILLKEDAEIRLVLDASKKKGTHFIGGKDQLLPPQRKAAIRQELSYMAYRLLLIRSEMELTEGVSYNSDVIGDIIRNLQYCATS